MDETMVSSPRGIIAKQILVNQKNRSPIGRKSPGRNGGELVRKSSNSGLSTLTVNAS